MNLKSVIDTVNKNLLRQGYVDFENEECFDPNTETVLEHNCNNCTYEGCENLLCKHRVPVYKGFVWNSETEEFELIE